MSNESSSNQKGESPNDQQTISQFVINTLFYTGMVSIAVIFAITPSYIFMFLWNRWLAKWVGSQPVADVTQVYSLLFCITVVVSIINALSNSHSKGKTQ